MPSTFELVSCCCVATKACNMVKWFRVTAPQTAWPRSFGFKLTIHDFPILWLLTVFHDWQKVSECMQHATLLLKRGAPNDAESALQVISEGLLISSYSEKLLEMKAESLFMVCNFLTEALELYF